MHSKERQQRVEFHSRETRPSQAPSDGEARRGSNNLAILGLMVKCAACVAVVTLLVVVGNGEHKAGMAGDVRSDAAKGPRSTRRPALLRTVRKSSTPVARASRARTPTPGRRFAVAGGGGPGERRRGREPLRRHQRRNGCKRQRMQRTGGDRALKRSCVPEIPGDSSTSAQLSSKRGAGGEVRRCC